MSETRKSRREHLSAELRRAGLTKLFREGPEGECPVSETWKSVDRGITLHITDFGHDARSFMRTHWLPAIQDNTHMRAQHGGSILIIEEPHTDELRAGRY